MAIRDAVAKIGARLDSLVNHYSGLGSGQDAAVAARPSIANRLGPDDIDKLILANDLARRIVEELVDDALRQGYEIHSDGQVLDEPDHLCLNAALREAAVAARTYGGGAVVMMHPGDLAKPLDMAAGSPASLLVVDRYEASALTYDNDPLSATFTHPRTWQVSPNAPAGAMMLDQPVVHSSRMLLLQGAALPRRLRIANDGWNDSVLQACWTPLQNFCSAEQAIANIIQRFEIGVYSIAGLKDVLDDPQGSGDILQRFRLMQRTVSMVNAVVIDRDGGEEYSRNYSQVGGLDTLWDRLAHSVAKAAKMPMTQLFGMSPSGLATDDQSGRANWRKQVAVYQTGHLEPLILAYYRLLNGGKPVSIIWHPLDEAPAKEQAEIDKLRAETREIYAAMGAADPREFRPGMRKEGLIEDVASELFTSAAEQDEELDPYEPREPSDGEL